MYTVKRMYDVPGPTLGDGVKLGTASTVDELRDLLDGMFGMFEVAGAVRTVKLDLEAALGDDRAFLEQVMLAADGVISSSEWVSL